jgi:Tol biopolymer transport system component
MLAGHSCVAKEPPARRRTGRAAAVALIVTVTACGTDRSCNSDPLAAACALDDLAAAPKPLLVFQSNRHNAVEVYTANADGTGMARLTVNPSYDGLPRWSPDGQRIAFVSARTGASEIWVMNADGSDQRQVTQLRGEAMRPAWSPDGRRLAFDLRRADGNYDIHVVNVDGSGLQRLTATNSQFRARWSSDGRQLLMIWLEETVSCPRITQVVLELCNARLAVMNADGSGLRLLPPVGLQQTWAEWSPDSRFILFAGYQSPGSGMPARSQVMIMKADGTGARTLTTTMLDEWSPTWSRSTNRIFFIRAWEIYSMRPDGSDVRRVSATPSADMLVDSR